jgi:hypothetical protein
VLFVSSHLTTQLGYLVDDLLLLTLTVTACISLPCFGQCVHVHLHIFLELAFVFLKFLAFPILVVQHFPKHVKYLNP